MILLRFKEIREAADMVGLFSLPSPYAKSGLP